MSEQIATEPLTVLWPDNVDCVNKPFLSSHFTNKYYKPYCNENRAQFWLTSPQCPSSFFLKFVSKFESYVRGLRLFIECDVNVSVEYVTAPKAMDIAMAVFYTILVLETVNDEFLLVYVFFRKVLIENILVHTYGLEGSWSWCSIKVKTSIMNGFITCKSIFKHYKYIDK